MSDLLQPFFMIPIADQIYGDQEMHGSIRKLCMDYMVRMISNKYAQLSSTLVF